MKKLAVVGSSGGNLYNLGGKEPLKLIGEIITQANSTDFNVTDVVFVGANKSMDNIDDKTQAKLYYLDNGNLISTEYQSLDSTNQLGRKHDEALADKILNNEIDGIIFASADPKRLNNAAIKAAAEKKIPVVGTGGSAMADIQSMGANVIAVSGTTGTTNRTRAVSAISSLAKYYDFKYTPVIGKSAGGGDLPSSSNIKDRISIRGIMMSSLPGFISMSILLALSKIPNFDALNPLVELLIGALPVMVAAVAAYQISGLDEVGIISGIIAGILSKDGGLIGGIIGGIIAGVLATYLTKMAFRYKFPGTTANIVAGGLSGLIAGLIVYFLLSPVTLWLGNGIREIIQTALNFNSILAGVVAGALIWPAILGGVYHAAILPIVLLEMETNGGSFLGAIDMVSLVMVSAGITLGNILFPRKVEDRSIAIPGFLINMVFGTFVEAAYPFMLSNKKLFALTILASAVAGGVVGFFKVEGTAYVPSLVAPALSNHTIGMVVSMLVGLGLSLLFTFICNKSTKQTTIE